MSAAASKIAMERAGVHPGEIDLIVLGTASPDHLLPATAVELQAELGASRAAAFDIRRDPNPHLAFGHGIHFCLGASLARLEMRVMFEELLPRVSTCELVRPVEWTRSNRHTGIRHLFVRLGGTEPTT